MVTDATKSLLFKDIPSGVLALTGASVDFLMKSYCPLEIDAALIVHSFVGAIDFGGLAFRLAPLLELAALEPPLTLRLGIFIFAERALNDSARILSTCILLA